MFHDVIASSPNFNLTPLNKLNELNDAIALINNLTVLNFWNHTMLIPLNSSTLHTTVVRHYQFYSCSVPYHCRPLLCN